MIDTEAAETLMSLSAPDERKFASPLYAKEMPWHAAKKQRAFDPYGTSPPQSRHHHHQQQRGFLASSLPSSSSSFMQHAAPSMSMLRHNIQERPLTSLIPAADDSDEDMDTDQEDLYDSKQRRWGPFRSPFDGLVAAARDYADSPIRDDTDDDDSNSSSGGGAFNNSSSRPITIPMHPGRHQRQQRSGSYRSEFSMSAPKSSLTRVKEDSASHSYMGLESSPTGIEEDSEWFDSYRESTEYKQRARLASICSSDGSEYGGLGRKNFEGFLRMDLSDENERAENHSEGSSPPDARFIGSYSPEARRKRIERFLEKRKHRVWSKKVDYDVRKNFANSRLRVKGRFVKKEDEELLCQLLSYT